MAEVIRQVNAVSINESSAEAEPGYIVLTQQNGAEIDRISFPASYVKDIARALTDEAKRIADAKKVPAGA